MSVNLDHEVASEFFGWKWMAFDGIPVRGTPNYPTKRRVRQFFPPEVFDDPQWQDHFKKCNASPAIGDEPLSYRYGSSIGPHDVPAFSDDEAACRKVERAICELGKWREYANLVSDEYGDEPSVAVAFASCDLRCRIALAIKRAEATPCN